MRRDARVELLLHLRANDTDRLLERGCTFHGHAFRVLGQLPLRRHARLLGNRLRCLTEDAHLCLQPLHALLTQAQRICARAIG